jgi:hypothetical protein
MGCIEMFLGEYLKWWEKVSFVISKYPVSHADKQSFNEFHRYALSVRCYTDIKNETNRILIEEYKISDKDIKSIEG